MNYSLTKAQAKDLIAGKLSHFFGVSTDDATDQQYYQADPLQNNEDDEEGSMNFNPLE